MIEEINERARRLGFSFTFLIPADEGLVRYYSDRGFSPAFRTIINRYTAGHSFYRDYVNWIGKFEPELHTDLLRHFEKSKAYSLDSYSDLNAFFKGFIYDKISHDSRSEDDFSDDCGHESGVTGNEGCNIGFSNFKGEIIIPDSSREFAEINRENYHYFSGLNTHLNGSDDVIYNETDTLKLRHENIENRLTDSHDISFDTFYDFIRVSEASGVSLSLVHSPKDLMLVIRDCMNGGGHILIIANDENKICASGFIYISEKTISVRRIYYSDEGSRLRLLHEVTRKWPDLSLEVTLFPDQTDRLGLSDIYYGGASAGVPMVPTINKTERVESIASVNTRMYGLARILDISDFLKFLTKSRSDSKFSIFVRDSKIGNILSYSFNGENLKIDSLSKEKFREKMENPKFPFPVILSEQQLQSLLFRRREDGEDAIGLAFGLPPIPMHMSLLLD
ncbi:MAG: hypothetical protein HDS82_04845 [Bacteroidales bacterium]|nr:hypothetical protein [Bacteroidales bacterium]